MSFFYFFFFVFLKYFSIKFFFFIIYRFLKIKNIQNQITKILFKLAQKFKRDNFNKESLDQILTLCSAQLKYFHLEKDKILFRIGDKPDNFYLIINGRIGILKPISNHKEMTGLEYFYYIYVN